VKENRVEGNLALSRAIGDFTYKESQLPCDQQMVIALPDVKQVVIDSSCEFMIIACDGIWDCLENQQIIDQ
jgi:protein phosphatase 2C family protein 2/3